MALNLTKGEKWGLALGALSHVGRALTLGLAQRSADREATERQAPAQRRGGCPHCGKAGKPGGCPHCGKAGHDHGH